MFKKGRDSIPGLIFVYTLLILLVLFLYKSYTSKTELPPTKVVFTIPSVVPNNTTVTTTPLPTTTPYAGPNIKPSKEVSIEQEKELISQFSSSTQSVRVSSQIDNYAVIEEHVLPAGGGGWCVMKKESGVWKTVFCSENTDWCSLNQQYGLPPALLYDCVTSTATSNQ